MPIADTATKHRLLLQWLILVGVMGAGNEERLEAARGRPQHQHACEDRDLAALASAYGSALARSHCFTDGNKRIATLAVDVFLQMNGHERITPEPEPFIRVTRLASGEIGENELAEWIRVNLSPLLD